VPYMPPKCRYIVWLTNTKFLILPTRWVAAQSTVRRGVYHSDRPIHNTRLCVYNGDSYVYISRMHDYNTYQHVHISLWPVYSTLWYACNGLL